MTALNLNCIILSLSTIVSIFNFSSAQVSNPRDEYDFNKNGIVETITVDNTSKNFKIIWDKKKAESVRIPEILGYENIRIIYNDFETIRLHYSSDHVSTIELFVNYSVQTSSWILSYGVLYAPCQSCETMEVKTWEKEFGKALSSFTLTDNVEELGDLILSGDCRILYPNSQFANIYQYYTKIKRLELATKIFNIDEYLSRFPISKNTLENYNNIAYYLEKGKAYKESAYLLEKLIKYSPQRSVAYFNLGDAYWGLKSNIKAKQAYNTYISLMKKSGKEAKIPKRVYDRVK